jgi:hypothetical protein
MPKNTQRVRQLIVTDYITLGPYARIRKGVGNDYTEVAVTNLGMLDSNIGAVTTFTDVGAMIAHTSHTVGTTVSTGGTTWEVISDSGLTAGEYIPLIGSLAARQVTDIYVKDFGLSPDNTDVQNSDAWDAMVDIVPNIPGTGGPATGRLKFGVGEYEFSRSLELKRIFHLVGDSPGLNGVNNASRLSFSGNDDNAITVNRHNTLNGGVEGTPTTPADGTVIEGLQILARSRVPGKSGIWLRARAIIRNCVFTNFGEWGVKIVANSGGADDVLGNANNWVLHTVTCVGNGTNGVGGGGVYVDGADVNIGKAYALDSSSNYGRGLFESSFLGNTYTACHFASNGRTEANDDSSQVSHGGNRYYLVDESAGIGSSTTPGTDNDIWRLVGAGGVHSVYPAWTNGNNYTVGFTVHSDNANARNEFFGCYTESSQPPCRLNGPDKVYGGIMASGGGGFDSSSEGFIIAATSSGSGALSSFQVVGSDTTVKYGGELTDQYAVGLFEDSGNSNGITLQRYEAGKWGWSYANQGPKHGIYTDTTAEQAGRAEVLPANTPFFSSMVLGSGGTIRHFGRSTWTSGHTHPTSGEYAKGDVYIYAGVVAGDYIGVVCTTSGTAGSTAVFKDYGAIEA